MKGAKRHGNYINCFFLKNVLFQAIWSFWSKNGIYDLNFGLAVRFLFFLILHNKMGQILHQNFINCFFDKKLHLGQFDLARPFFTV